MAFGLVMGLGSVVSMLLSVRAHPGVIIDLRSPLVAIAGFFGGPVGAGIAALLAGGYRTWLGGSGTIAGLTGIGLSACIGTIGYLMTGRRGTPLQIGLLSLAVGTAALLSFMALPRNVFAEAFRTVLVPVAVLSAAATLVAGLIILQTRRLAAERHLLRAAIAQAPDYLYVKNTESEFVAVNAQVASHSGYARPEQMVGMTDRDIASPEHAAALRAQEQELLTSGVTVLNLEEHVTEGGQDPRWRGGSART